MPSWLEKENPKLARMFSHLVDDCEAEGRAGNCYQYAMGRVQQERGGKRGKTMTVQVKRVLWAAKERGLRRVARRKAYLWGQQEIQSMLEIVGLEVRSVQGGNNYWRVTLLANTPQLAQRALWLARKRITAIVPGAQWKGDELRTVGPGERMAAVFEFRSGGGRRSKSVKASSVQQILEAAGVKPGASQHELNRAFDRLPYDARYAYYGIEYARQKGLVPGDIEMRLRAMSAGQMAALITEVARRGISQNDTARFLIARYGRRKSAKGLYPPGITQRLNTPEAKKIRAQFKEVIHRAVATGNSQLVKEAIRLAIAIDKLAGRNLGWGEAEQRVLRIIDSRMPPRMFGRPKPTRAKD